MAAPPAPRPARMPSSFDYDPIDEPVIHKLKRKLREEPLVFLGLGLTVTAFINAALAIKRRDSWAAQKYFRARIGAQAFTVLAAVGGGLYYSEDRIRNRGARRAQAEKDAEQKRLRWIRELETRDAEDRRQRHQSRTLSAATTAAASAATAATPMLLSQPVVTDDGPRLGKQLVAAAAMTPQSDYDLPVPAAGKSVNSADGTAPAPEAAADEPIELVIGAAVLAGQSKSR